MKTSKNRGLDWRSGLLELRSVSLAARGLWAEILNLMVDSPEPGQLSFSSGAPIGVTPLARLTCTPAGIVEILLTELEHVGLIIRDDHGEIWSLHVRGLELERRYRSERMKAAAATRRSQSVAALAGEASPPIRMRQLDLFAGFGRTDTKRVRGACRRRSPRTKSPRRRDRRP
jgi:hypothetical protein